MDSSIDPVQRPLQALDQRFAEQFALRQLAHAAHFDGAAVLEDLLSAAEGSLSSSASSSSFSFSSPPFSSVSSSEQLARIPLLQTAADNWDILPGQLVRFVGMVQDMLEPEYFSAAARVAHKATGVERVVSGKYRDLEGFCIGSGEYELRGEVDGSLASRQVLCVFARR